MFNGGNEMSYEQAKSLLEKYGQTQLLKYYDELNDSQKESLLKQISEIDFGLLDLVKYGESVSEKGVITPLDDAVSIKDIEENKEKYTAIGVGAIKQGKVAALLLAGGMGTRLGSDKPKGMYNAICTARTSPLRPISPRQIVFSSIARFL